MPQSFTLYPDLTVRENVDFVASLFGMLWRSRRRRTREVLELVDLWDVRGRRAGRLSGGMQRRLELACALVHDPALLFLDEPTAGIDPLLRGRVWDELHRLRDEGRTLLVTTQYVNEAESCDQVALIAEGRLIALATPDELRRLAVGGDVIEIETAARFDGMALAELPFVAPRAPGRAATADARRRRRAGPRRRTSSTRSNRAAARSSTRARSAPSSTTCSRRSLRATRRPEPRRRRRATPTTPTPARPSRRDAEPPTADPPEAAA